MGITCGWITAESEAAELADAMLKAWDDCEVVRSVEGTGLDLLYEQSDQAAKEEKELNQVLSVWGFYQVGDRAVCIDPHAVAQEESDELARLSRLVGPTLGLTLATHGGTAGFGYYEEGEQVRRVWHCDGETELSGSPIDEEDDVNVDDFYWDECEQVWDAFDLGKLGEWDGPVRVIVIRNRATERLIEERNASRSSATSSKKPWWRFWNAWVSATTSAILIPFVLLAAGCDAAGEEVDSQVCADRATTLGTRLAQVDPDDRGQQLNAASKALAPVAPRGRTIDKLGPLARLEADRFFLDNRDIGEVGSAQTRSQLVSDLETLARTPGVLHDHGEGPHALYLVAAPTRDALQVLRHLEGLPPSYEPRLVVRDPAPPFDIFPASASDALRAKMKVIRSSPTQATLLAELMAKSFGGCAPLFRLMKKNATADPASRAKLLLDGVVPAVKECGCNGIDLDALETTVLAATIGSGPQMAWLPVRAARPDTPAAQVATAAKGMTVQELVAILSAVLEKQSDVFIAIPPSPVPSAGPTPTTP